MYKIFYSKVAAKDIAKLKAAHLDVRARRLIDLIKENPYQNPPSYERLVGSITSTAWFTKYEKIRRALSLSVCGHTTNGSSKEKSDGCYRFETPALQKYLAFFFRL